jgi:hypothetical protein
MCDRRIACSIGLLLWASAAAAQNQAPANVQQIADTMVRLCIGGGSTQAITGTATGGADISLRSLDVRGNLTGEFKISKSSAEGLIPIPDRFESNPSLASGIWIAATMPSLIQSDLEAVLAMASTTR